MHLDPTTSIAATPADTYPSAPLKLQQPSHASGRHTYQSQPQQEHSRGTQGLPLTVLTRSKLLYANRCAPTGKHLSATPTCCECEREACSATQEMRHTCLGIHRTGRHKQNGRAACPAHHRSIARCNGEDCSAAYQGETPRLIRYVHTTAPSPCREEHTQHLAGAMGYNYNRSATCCNECWSTPVPACVDRCGLDEMHHHHSWKRPSRDLDVTRSSDNRTVTSA